MRGLAFVAIPWLSAPSIAGASANESQNRAVRNKLTFRPGSTISSFLNEAELRITSLSRFVPRIPSVTSLQPVTAGSKALV